MIAVPRNTPGAAPYFNVVAIWPVIKRRKLIAEAWKRRRLSPVPTTRLKVEEAQAFAANGRASTRLSC